MRLQQQANASQPEDCPGGIAHQRTYLYRQSGTEAAMHANSNGFGKYGSRRCIEYQTKCGGGKKECKHGDLR